jgi:hypothetical protein
MNNNEVKSIQNHLPSIQLNNETVIQFNISFYYYYYLARYLCFASI